MIKGTITVAEAARVLGVDKQTVRLLLQTQIVDWGVAYRRGDSRQYSYLIYSEPFGALTGYKGGEL